MSLNKLAKSIHENAVSHGWWNEERNFGEIIALCHSELSEALEEYRDGKPFVYNTCAISPSHCEHFNECGGIAPGEKPCKPEGIAVELADCIIRILDYCGKEKIDIESIINAKHEYNKTRPFKHGNKRI